MKEIMTMLLAGTVLHAAELKVECDRPAATYSCGGKVVFSAEATVNGEPVKEGKMNMILTLDNYREVDRQSVEIRDGAAELSYVAREPTFVWCRAELENDASGNYGLASAAFEPEHIRQGFPEPADFDRFWAQGQAEAEAGELDLQLEYAADFADTQRDAWRLEFAAPGGGRLYGMLTIPKGEGNFPAMVMVPGAGPSRYVPDFHIDGVINLYINVHDYRPVADPEPAAGLYDALNASGSYMHRGADARENIYFRRVWLGVDLLLRRFLAGHPKFNGRLGAIGISQGGGAALALAALNPMIGRVLANKPVMCDHGAILQGRNPGWPHYAVYTPAPDILEVSSYYEMANFARRIKVPATVIIGYVDTACYPGGVYAAVNNLKSALGTVIPEPGVGHEWGPHFEEEVKNFKEFLLP